jgi:hypothetical protein
MFVTVTLNSGHGISLGPRFFLIPNVGYASPFEASISELLAGKVIEVSDSATELQVISNGACENGITLVIGAPPTTTTAAPTTTTAAPTTTTAAPTTTTAAPTTTTAAPTTTTAAPETTTTAAPTTTTAAPTTTTTTTSGGGPACTYDGLTIVCDTTTTTTAAPTYSFLRCDVYSCTGGGALLESDVIVRIPTGSPTPSIFSSLRWYYTTPFDGKAYYLTSTSVAGPSYDATLVNDPQTSRSSACSVGASVTTTTTTSTTTTTTTTTTAAPVCDQYEIQNFTESSIGISYYDCSGNYTALSIGSGNNLIFCSNISYGAIDAGGGTLTNIGSCAGGTTTTTEAPPLESVFCDCGAGCAEYFQPFCPPGCEACII